MSTRTRLTAILLAIACLTLAGCKAAPKYTLQCDINTQSYGFGIKGETGSVTQSQNSEVTQFQYAASGQKSGITVGINRDLTYENTKHTYHLEGTIQLNTLTNELTYSITATGDAFGKTPQTCKNP